MNRPDRSVREPVTRGRRPSTALAGAVALVFALSLSAVDAPRAWELPPELSMPGNGFASGTVTPLATGGLVPAPTESGWRVRLPGGYALATPAVVDGRVFIGGGFGSHEFYAFDAVTGAPSWAIRVSDDGPTTAVVRNGQVAFNTESCTLFVVRAQDGSQVWSSWLGDPLMSQPTIDGDRLYMVYPAGATHRLAAFALGTGQVLWRADVDTDAITAPIAVDGDVYMASMAGRLYRFDGATGELHWSREERLTSAPWIRGEQIFAAMHDETEAGGGPMEGVGYLSRGGGERQQAAGRTWSRTEAPWLSREVQDRSRYGDQNVQADDAVGFKPSAPKGPSGAWRKLQGLGPDDGDNVLQTGMGSPGGAPAGARVDEAARNIGQSSVSGLWGYQGSRPTLFGNLAIATVGERVEAIDVESGETVWSHSLSGNVAELGGHLGTPPAVADGRVYVATTTGEIIALDPSSGERVWQANVGAPVRSQPVIVGGRVYAGTTTGELIMVDTGHRTGTDWPMWGGSAAHQQ